MDTPRIKVENIDSWGVMVTRADGEGLLLNDIPDGEYLLVTAVAGCPVGGGLMDTRTMHCVHPMTEIWQNSDGSLMCLVCKAPLSRCDECDGLGGEHQPGCTKGN